MSFSSIPNPSLIHCALDELSLKYKCGKVQLFLHRAHHSDPYYELRAKGKRAFLDYHELASYDWHRYLADTFYGLFHKPIPRHQREGWKNRRAPKRGFWT